MFAPWSRCFGFGTPCSRPQRINFRPWYASASPKYLASAYVSSDDADSVPGEWGAQSDPLVREGTTRLPRRALRTLLGPSQASLSDRTLRDRQRPRPRRRRFIADIV